jgi:hypothetical protein
MIRDDRWTTAGTEPHVTDMLSDPATRTLMSADGVTAEEVNAILERIRRDVQPARLVPRNPAPDRIMSGSVKPLRALPLRRVDQAANTRVASGVITRWIASLVSDQRVSQD